MSTQEFPNAYILQRHLTRPVWRNFQSLFKGLTLLKVLPNFMCYKDRRDSFELCKYQECFDKMGVPMVAISDQPTGSNEFIKHANWQGELYLNINHDICRHEPDTSAKNFIRRQTSKLNSHLNRKQTQARALFKLGGTYVVTSDFQVIYAHEPKSSSDSPCAGFILNLCRSYNAASKSMNSQFQPVFTKSLLTERPKLNRWDSSETVSSHASSLPSLAKSTQFFFNQDFTSIFG
ncbi:hypothetical protein DSO57_1038107 [Entomophthora muscae]|uniref:Uncharacterized protein n=2 Tax=Entomophthora muscae TaxID=34485 RepID=A0ACC2TKP6_9FUNG|nr:hypothetical protein DSO57_1003911 [Entomophthora muscae]KAJ9075223.1 hypothetical protein DSO57_1038107 [Entomophthora muscae]